MGQLLLKSGDISEQYLTNAEIVISFGNEMYKVVVLIPKYRYF